MAEQKSTKAKSPPKTVTVHINPALPSAQRFTVAHGEYGGLPGETFKVPPKVFAQFKDWAVEHAGVEYPVFVEGKGPAAPEPPPAPKLEGTDRYGNPKDEAGGQ